MLSNYLKNKFFSHIQSGVMVEVGAAGPEFLSQSKPFRDIGWRCICIEPNPEFAQMHKNIGNEIYEYACSDQNKTEVDFYISTSVILESFSSLGVDESICINSGFAGKDSISFKNIKVTVKKLNNILEESKVSKVDYVIVDVEGWELNVMRGFDTYKYQPRVIVLEVIGSEKQKYHDYMSSLGYVFDSFDDTTGPNLVYYNPNY